MKQFWKRTAAAALCGALLCPTALAAERYIDVPAGAWYAQAAAYCRENGLMGGTGDNRFSPQGTVTRSTLAVVLWRMAGSPAAEGGTAFSDTAPDAWYAGAVAWAGESGVMGGYANGRFGPQNPVTREQLAAVLWRMAGSPAAQAPDYADEDAIGAFAAQAVDWARAANLMSGRADGRFGPKDTLTRAHLAQVLANRAGISGHTAGQAGAMDVMCQPCGIAAMEDGSLLVTDRYNKVIWRVANGKSTIFAGTDTAGDAYGQPVGGYHDDTLLKSSFKDPWAIAPFLDGWAVSDVKNGVVRFLRTGARKAGQTEVTDLGVRFDHPTGLAADGAGNLYVSETFLGKIIKVTPKGEVTTLASNLSEPMGLCWADGSLYAAECGGNRILKISGSGRVSTVAGSGENGSADGSASQAAFSGPKGVAVDADGTVYAADTDNGTVRRIRDGQVTTILSRDPADTSALFPVSPTGLLIQGNTLYISDTFARKLLALPMG